MKLVKELPKSGQFAAVWENGEIVFTGTFLWGDGHLYKDGLYSCDPHDLESRSPVYYIAE